MGDLNSQLKDYLNRNEVKKEAKLFPGSESLKKLLSSSSTELSPDTPISKSWFTEAENDSCFPTLSKKQRITGFVGFILAGFFCLFLAGMYAPVLVLKARKFALLYTLGSLFIISSFAFLRGPMNHLRHLFSRERLPFTLAYFGTTFATLYFALVVRSTLPTALFALCQVVSLLWFILTYIPGGQTGLRFFSKVFTGMVTRTASKTLPV